MAKSHRQSADSPSHQTKVRHKLMQISLWINTLKDIPPTQLVDRLWFEGQQRLYRRLPKRVQQAWVGAAETPEISPKYLSELYWGRLPHIGQPASGLEFSFLGQLRVLDWPIPWNSPEYPRLWQFNLHYFDWIREDLNQGYKTGSLSQEALHRLGLVPDWITHNSVGSFDGWHPYPTSLRLVNWTWLLRSLPELQTPTVRQSLWLQICYLNQCQETFFQGNHWFENLAALIIAGLNFQGAKAEKIVNRAMNHLCQQLSIQVLADGGHFERSPMYHLILLKRLWEIILCLQNARWQTPPTLLSALAAMTTFAQSIRLADGTYPLWNDCAYDVAEPLDEIVACTHRVLGWSSRPLSPFNQRLFDCGNPAFQATANFQITEPPAKPSVLTALPASGYFLLRPGTAAEITFDAAPPCPRALPAHAHSDCLSFDLYWKGQPLIVETGTSQYGSGSVRQWERGTLAHNTVAFAPSHQSSTVFEQTQVWGGFRAACKAQPEAIEWGSQNSWHWVTARHTGYDRLGGNHQRWLGCTQTHGFVLVVFDWLQAQQSLGWLQQLHLGPVVVTTQQLNAWNLQLSGDEFKLYHLTPDAQINHQVTLGDSWYSPQFGCRLPRSVLTTTGYLSQERPEHLLCTILTCNLMSEFTVQGSFESGILQQDGLDIVAWVWHRQRPVVTILSH